MFYKKGDPVRCIRRVQGLVRRANEPDVKYQKYLYLDEVYWVRELRFLSGCEVVLLEGMGSTCWPESLFIPIDMEEFNVVVYTGDTAKLKRLEPK